MNSIQDKYNRISRIYPSVITFISLLIIGAICCVNHWNFILGKASSVVVGLGRYLIFVDSDKTRVVLANASSVSILTAVLYAFFLLLILLVREVGKVFPESLLWSWFGAPTTRLLCNDNACFTDEYKARVFDKILSRYKVDLNKIRSRTFANKKFVKEVCGVVAQIREDTRDNKVLLDFNTIYGFWRNLGGGMSILILGTISMLAIGSILGVKFLTWYQGITICGILTVFDLVCVCVSDCNGVRYATQLYTILLGLPDQRLEQLITGNRYEI